jgi:phospholipase C
MTFRKSRSKLAYQASHLVLAFIAMMQFTLFEPIVGSIHAADSPAPTTGSPITPIQHVIVIIGENRTFDHLFATYQPKAGQTVNNLLSENIIDVHGNPSGNYAAAHQFSATDTTTYELAPTKTPYGNLPTPLNGGPASACTNNGMCNLGDAVSTENALSRQPVDYNEFLLTGGTGLTGAVPDTRINGVHGMAPYSTLAPGPFQLTNSASLPYDSYAASPVHRFYQMWQQEDCAVSHKTATNPSGCLADLFPWVEVTIGAGSNGAAQPANFSTDYALGKKTTGEGATSMGFYNMASGDAPYTKMLADNYAMSDNFHQSVMGGTGANHIMLGFGDAIWFSDENGTPETPPEGITTSFGGPVNEIENPNPASSTNNWYSEDGYGAFGDNGTSTGVYGGGSYSECADSSQSGVGPIVSYLSSIGISPNCEAGHYYLLNNYNPGYFSNGSDAYQDTNPNNTPFTVPGTTQRSIADVLMGANISWATYFDQWDQYVNDPYQLNYGKVGPNGDEDCNICNPFQYEKGIMTNDAIRTTHMFDTDQLDKDIKNGKLPAVSFVKPSGWVDGHPASSKWDLFEAFVKKIVDEVQSNPDLWATTAIFVTADEGGGYYDSGYVQPLDFFGDGTRIPLIVVSPWTTAGHISHSYADHVSILKFIERNWKLPKVTGRSRDNLANPTTSTSSGPYVPTNSPAISDLFDLFSF